MVKIEIERINDAFHMRAKNESGATLDMDATPDLGGQNLGMRPMQVLLTSLGGCSGIDVISILKKQRQPLEDIRISLTGEREAGVEPSIYREIHVHYKFFGDIDAEKAGKAISLSLEKYCSVARTLQPTAKITSSFEIVR